MFRKLALAIFSISILNTIAHAQDRLDEIVPLVSAKDDVVKLIGEPSNMDAPGSFVYSFDDQVVRITFYNGGCSPDVEKDLRLLPGKVIEVRRTQNTRVEAKYFLRDWLDYETYRGHGGENLHYRSTTGIVATTRTENSTELIKNIFRIGPRKSLHECLSKSLDDDSAISELHYFGAMVSEGSAFKFPPVQIGRYFDEDSKKAKDEIINEFVKALLARKKAVGRVIVDAGKKDPVRLIEIRTGRLLDTLKKKGKRCLKLVIDTGHRGGLSGASFWVTHESLMAGSTVTIHCP